jgi:sRNA-binding protein
MNFVNTALRNEKERVVQLQRENKQESFTVEEAAKTLSVEPSNILALIGSGELQPLEPIRINPDSVYGYWLANLEGHGQAAPSKGQLAQRANAKAKWADPDWAARQAEKIREGHAKAKAKREARFEPTTTIVARAGEPPPVSAPPKPYPPDAPQPPFVKTMEADGAALNRPRPPVAQPYVPPHTLRYRQLTDRLRREFPLAFSKPPNVRPLALDIYTQACKALPETDPDDLLRVIRYYQDAFAYLTAMTRPGARRGNLDGTDAGAVLAVHAKEARDRLQELAWRKEEGRR